MIPKWTAWQERWLKFFVEGERLDEARLPEWMQTVEKPPLPKSSGLKRCCKIKTKNPIERISAVTRRFGELPAWVETRLRDTSPEQLETWAERLLVTSPLEEVFEASGGH